jgi:hypothetical protein
MENWLIVGLLVGAAIVCGALAWLRAAQAKRTALKKSLSWEAAWMAVGSALAAVLLTGAIIVGDGQVSPARLTLILILAGAVTLVGGVVHESVMRRLRRRQHEPDHDEFDQPSKAPPGDGRAV